MRRTVAFLLVLLAFAVAAWTGVGYQELVAMRGYILEEPIGPPLSIYAGGWPHAFVISREGEWPANRITFRGMLRGTDAVHPWHFAGDVGFYWFVFAIAHVGVRRVRRGSAPRATGRRRARSAVAFLLALPAFVIAAATGEGHQRISSEYIPYPRLDGSLDSTRVVAGGWPLPFLLDNPQLAPGNSVHITSVIDHVDHVRLWRYLADALLFWGVCALLYFALRRMLRRSVRA